MIIGGNVNYGLTDSIELFNWQSQEQCSYPGRLPKPLSQLSGAVIEGVPVICGGYGPGNSRSKECYKLDAATASWVPVSICNDQNLLYPVANTITALRS